ncbi:hypothetical protein NA78x_002322 [Anatilimnocola sp. NA78]|uniref:hypothetical protein n=1 Tax=Anatilimnocola sp. NA78 TaxID=3415683 RepID=UPI003CE4F7A3
MSTDQRVNPYESPQVAEHLLRMPLSPRERVVQRLRGPTLGLMLLAGMQAIPGLLFAISLVLGVTAALLGFVELGAVLREPVSSIMLSLLAPVQCLIFLAALRMRQLRHLRFCRTMAIVACIPILSPVMYFGIPFGIWATVLLFRADTAAEFDRAILSDLSAVETR